MRKSKIVILVFIFLYFINNLFARDFILGDISDRNISITASFTGANIIIYGSIDPKIYNYNNIYITVVGPKTNLKLRKKSKILGLWVLEKKYINIDNLPSYYAIASNANSNNFSGSTFKINEIGWENVNLDFPQYNSVKEKQFYFNILKDLYLDKKLYVSKLSKINVIRDTLFRSEFELPATALVGSYEVNMFLISKEGKELIAIWSDNISVTKQGISAKLFDFSKNYSFLYGIFAAIGAILVGFFASEIFRRL